MDQKRCGWCGKDPIYVEYHDHVWGRPVADSRELFAKLCLDGQQAGLSWITILKKQPHYEKVFYNFAPEKIVRLVPKKFDKLMADPGIVRNKLKIESIVRNARAYLEMQEKGINFSHFLWEFVDFTPIQGQRKTMKQLPANTDASDRMSKALKKLGFNFVGSTICYAFMQAVGMVNDHLVSCHCYEECASLGKKFKLP